MKKTSIILLILALIMSLAITSCGGDTPTVCDEHIDENNDAVCDSCGAAVEKPCTEHVDANNDAACDNCGAAVEKPCTEHVDANTDAVCDSCGASLTITIAEALELCGESGNITTERYFIRATVVTVTNVQYGSMKISDSTGEISVYGTYSGNDGEIYFADLENKPVKGDEVLLYCILQNYNGTKEVKNARLISFKSNAGNFDASAYTEMSISDAREATEGTMVKVDGVVARITYANGMKPSGFILVDEGASIYVYDGDAAQNVQIGNKITIAASKTYWVLDTEANNAAKFGYKGCNQLDSATIIDNDKKTDNSFDKSWITESTVKEIVENPVSNDITTIIYKVNALVRKVEGTGFTNYYFNDLDGTTGSYTYTQCNGSDFAWLDEFDGKICTVYLMALNAKSTASGCSYRFLPVEVIDEGYTFDTNDAAEHAVKYYGVDQFLSEYSADPELELITSVSSTLLGFENATLSYRSSDETIITFTTVGGKVVMNCVGCGEVTVTVTGSYGNNQYSETVKITVSESAIYDTITVSDAIDAAVGEEVIVKGIVGPSLVNRTGFYLMDEDGMIAVIVNDGAVLKTLSVGNEIIIKGTRHNNTKGGADYYGQTCINNSEVLVNNFGSHDYSTDYFITDKTLADIKNLDVTEDHTTSVYVVKAKIEVVETAYYTSISIISVDGTTKLELYSSSASQYNWLKQFAGQEITLELALCNWNDKKFYKGSVLAVITEDDKVYNTLNFQ